MLLNAAQLYSLFVSAGFSPGVDGNAVKMGAIALRESGGEGASHADAAARNSNLKTGDNSFGLLQINLLDSDVREFVFKLVPAVAKNPLMLLGAEVNAHVGYLLSRNFAPWAVKDLWFYRDGLEAPYLEHLPQMREAAAASATLKA